MPPTSDRDTNFILGHVIPHLDWLIALVSLSNPLAGQVRRYPVYNSSIMSRSSHPHNSTATAAPVTGQYYFMLVTLFWKRYQKKTSNEVNRDTVFIRGHVCEGHSIRTNQGRCSHHPRCTSSVLSPYFCAILQFLNHIFDAPMADL